FRAAPRPFGKPPVNDEARKSRPAQPPGNLRLLTLGTNENRRMKVDWPATSGPALTAATALIAFFVDRNVMAVPNPAPLLVCIVAFAGSMSGLVSGLISAAIAVAASALFFLIHRSAPGYDSADLVRLAMLVLTAAGTAAITGLFRKRMIDAFAWERTHYTTAERLSAALDEVDIGIVLLDADTRAEFINRAFRHYFSLPDEKADSKPPFIALMYHGRDTGAFELPEDELSAFIARRSSAGLRLRRLGVTMDSPLALPIPHRTNPCKFAISAAPACVFPPSGSAATISASAPMSKPRARLSIKLWTLGSPCSIPPIS